MARQDVFCQNPEGVICFYRLSQDAYLPTWKQTNGDLEKDKNLTKRRARTQPSGYVREALGGLTVQQTVSQKLAGQTAAGCALFLFSRAERPQSRKGSHAPWLLSWLPGTEPLLREVDKAFFHGVHTHTLGHRINPQEREQVEPRAMAVNGRPGKTNRLKVTQSDTGGGGMGSLHGGGGICLFSKATAVAAGSSK